MAEHLSLALSSQLSELLETQTGLHFPQKKWPDLERALCVAAPALGFDDVPSFVEALLACPADKSRIETLASCLTIGESYFFREKSALDLFSNQVLPALIRARRGANRQIRIWSAGCSTGEEPYTLAILLKEAIPDLCSWNVSILGTDITPSFLSKANDGVYGEWSFRMTTPSAKEKYFQKTSTGKFQVSPEIKRLVHFSFLNLADNAYPSLSTGTNAMDAIWCRNVLIYMGHETARRIVHSFHDCLVDGGVLVVSPTETSAIRCSGLVAATPHGAPVYRRTAPLHESQRMQAPSSIAPLPPSPQLPRHANETSVAPAAPEDPIRTAWALYEKRLYREAEEILGDVLLERPDNAEANALLARVCANEGKLGDAAKWCGKALAADKLNPAYYYLQATVLQEQDEIERAVACLKQALYLNRDFVLAHFALGNLARLQGKLSESRKHFAIALALLTDIDDNEIVPESDGLTAGRLVQIIVGTKEGTPSP